MRGRGGNTPCFGRLAWAFERGSQDGFDNDGAGRTDGEGLDCASL